MGREFTRMVFEMLPSEENPTPCSESISPETPRAISALCRWNG